MTGDASRGSRSQKTFVGEKGKGLTLRPREKGALLTSLEGRSDKQESRGKGDLENPMSKKKETFTRSERGRKRKGVRHLPPGRLGGRDKLQGRRERKRKGPIIGGWGKGRSRFLLNLMRGEKKEEGG